MAMTDWRNAAEWPAGAKPVSRSVQYDDLYRVTNVGLRIPRRDRRLDVAVLRRGLGTAPDPRLAIPAPHVSFTNRVESQTFQYDWLGNTSRAATTLTASTTGRSAP